MSKNTDERIPFTGEMRHELKAWQTKTGFGMISLFKYAQRTGLFKERKGFTAGMMNNLLQGKSETVKTVDYQAVLSAYNDIPHAMWGKAHAMSRLNLRIPISKTFKEEIRQTFDESGLSRPKLLKLYNAPKGLNSTKISNILNRNETILRSHADFLEKLIADRKDR